MSMKNVIAKATMGLKKHSPAIFTGIGVVGLGATAYLAYKSRDKVEEVVEKIEEKNAMGEEVNKVEVARDIAEAVYQPVVMGAVSITCIIMAHRIQHKRILTLAGALAVEQTRNVMFEDKYKKKHGEEEYRKFITPTEEVEVITTDKKGKEKITVEEVKKDVDRTIGQWYDESSEYASDDHTYNLAMIDAVNERMQTRLFQRGTLTLNEVREALGFERIRAGALLGWTSSDSFDIDRVVTNLGKEDEGEALEQIWVTWTRPRYIYEEIDLNGGRYSI